MPEIPNQPPRSLWASEVRTRLAGLQLSPAREAEIISELSDHLDDHWRERVVGGASTEEATTASLALFRSGDLLGRYMAPLRQSNPTPPPVPGASTGSVLTDIRQDLRYSLRAYAKRPALAIAAIVTLALGIGANSAIFTVVSAVLLRPLPYPSPERLAILWTHNPRQGYDKDVNTYPNFDDWRRQSASFEGLAAYFQSDYTLTQAGDPAHITGAVVTPGFFETLGIAPAHGRPFDAREGAAGGERVAILGHGVWQTRFGGDPAVVGRSIMLNSVSHEVVGVMPASFAHPEAAQIWTPLAPSPRFAELMQARGTYWLQVFGRLKPGIAHGAAQAEMDTIAAALERQYPNVNTGIGVRIVPMHEEIVGNVRQPLLILFGAAAFVLLVACANVANLLLARAASRRKELAIRAALGAGRGRLIRQLLLESLVLAAAGGGAGLLLAAWGIQVLPSLAPSNLPRLTGIRIDGLVILYTMAASLATGLIFGAGPALRDAAGAAGEFLKERGAESSGSRGRRLRSVVATAEIAVALVLVIGAGLLVRSFIKLNSEQLGFDPQRVLAVRVHLPAARYAERGQIAAFYDDLVGRLRALPGVESVGLGSSVQRGSSAELAVEGRPPLPRNVRNLPVGYDTVTTGFFETLRIPLRHGQFFRDTDGPTAPLSVVVNDFFVDRFFPGEDPLGKRVTFGDPTAPNPPWLTIVGVVGDTRRAGLERATRAEVFYSHTQATDRRMYALIRTKADPLALVRSAQAQVWAIDPNQPIYSIRPVDSILADSQADRRFTTLLLGLFSIVALALAAVGIYGVMAYSTAQRVQEFGVRLALGARRTDVLTMVLKEGVLIGAAGLVVGIAAALALTRVMSGLLFGVSVRDPVTFVALPLALLLVTVLATLIPAARAVRVNPVIALRGD